MTRTEYRVTIETKDGSVEDLAQYGPGSVFTNKRKAISYARQFAKSTSLEDVVRVWVDLEDIGVANFKTRWVL